VPSQMPVRSRAISAYAIFGAAVLLDLGVGKLASQLVQRGESAFLIGAHQARITHHIGGEDRGKTAGGGRRGHCSAALIPVRTLT
jgi:hypothetical protein